MTAVADPIDSPGLTFDEADHRYEVDGRVVPSVTQCLKRVTDQIYGDMPEWVFKRAAERGTQAHKATEYDDLQMLDYDALDTYPDGSPVTDPLSQLRPYVDAWRKFRAETGFEVEEIELRLYHPVWGYSGTIDRVGRLHGKRVILDIKTTVDLHDAVGLQVAGYMELYNHGRPRKEQATQRWAAQLKRDGNFRLHQYADSGDWSVFLAYATTHKWEMNHL